MPERTWSPQQTEIFQWFGEGTGHLVVNACAGTGKTTTLVEGVNRAPEKYVLVVAFSKIIADELQRRVTRENVDAKTAHSLGYFFIRREWRGIGVEEKRNARAIRLVEDSGGLDYPMGMKKLIGELHTMGRDLHPTDYSTKTLTALAIEYDLAPDQGWVSAGWTLERVVAAALAAIREAAQTPPDPHVGIDFADMMFLPFAYNLLEPMYDLVVVDELQDFSKAQTLMALAVCRGRVAGFGDRRQAIFGFRGADTGSIDRIKQQLDAAELPLTVTYRCSQSVVREAQKIVPVIEAHVSNPEGSVFSVDYRDMLQEAKPTDFILSRLNAPLVRITLRLLMQRKKARMRGREIGRQLVGITRKLARPHMTAQNFLSALDKWESKQVTYALSHNDPELADKVRDQAAMIASFFEGGYTVNAVIEDIERLFVDTTDEDTIICSSIHKAKGLEAPMVWVLKESLYRRGWNEDEENCDYVATTRAKRDLRFVYGVPGLEPR
jgi:superfamily I DNA/RNA helicase